MKRNYEELLIKIVSDNLMNDDHTSVVKAKIKRHVVRGNEGMEMKETECLNFQQINRNNTSKV